MIPKMRLSARVCLASIFSLAVMEIVPLSNGLERVIRSLVHQPHHSGPPQAPTPVSSISVGGGGKVSKVSVGGVLNFTSRLGSLVQRLGLP